MPRSPSKNRSAADRKECRNRESSRKGSSETRSGRRPQAERTKVSKPKASNRQTRAEDRRIDVCPTRVRRTNCTMWVFQTLSLSLNLLVNAPLLADIEELEGKLRESEAEKYVLQKKIRLTEESVESVTRRSSEEVNMLKQQLESLRNSNSSAQDKIKRMKSDYDELNEQHRKTNGLFQSVGLVTRALIS